MSGPTFLKVKEYIKKHNMIDQGDCIIAGISGGADSMVMLEMLEKLRHENETELYVVHVNHGIRGDEAVRDENTVRDFCNKMKIHFTAYHFDVPGLALEWKMGHEETGRIVRRRAFAEEKSKCAKEDKHVKIALAHNQNDVAETMLHNMARGSGIRGLCSLKPLNGEIIRPVLCLTRSEIIEYAKLNNITYMTDSTNLEDEYTRNRIRNHILPTLTEKVNNEAIAHMAMTSEILSSAEQYFDEKASNIADECMHGNQEYLLNDSFFGNADVIKAYTIREILERLSGQTKDLSAVHINQIMDLYGHRTGRKINLPYNLAAKRDYAGVIIYTSGKVKTDDSKQRITEKKLAVPGKTSWGEHDFAIRVFDYNGEEISQKKYTKWFDCDKISCELTVRTRQSGDYIIVNSNGSHKKITRCMIDDKIACDIRDDIPLIAEESEILWIVGSRMSEKYKISADTKKVLEINFQGGIEHE